MIEIPEIPIAYPFEMQPLDLGYWHLEFRGALAVVRGEAERYYHLHGRPCYDGSPHLFHGLYDIKADRWVWACIRNPLNHADEYWLGGYGDQAYLDEFDDCNCEERAQQDLAVLAAEELLWPD